MTMTVQDSGAFVVRLGNDTLSMEQYTRTATQLRGEYVIRSPRSLHRIYTFDLYPDGTIRRLQLVTHAIGGGPGPAETRNSVDFSGDSAVLVSPRGDSSVTTKLAVPRGTFPFQLHVYGLLEQIGRWARAQGKDSVRLTALTSATATSGAYVVKRGGDTLVIMFDEGQYAGVGPFTFRLDRQGHLTWVTGKGSTLQVEVQRVPSVPMAQVTQSFANRPLGSLSPRDTARATIAGAEVSIDYSRPSRRARAVEQGVAHGRQRRDAVHHAGRSRHRRRHGARGEVHALDLADADGLEAHHQQADGTVGHRVSPRAGSRARGCESRNARCSGRAIHDRVRAGLRTDGDHLHLGQDTVLRARGEAISASRFRGRRRLCAGRSVGQDVGARHLPAHLGAAVSRDAPAPAPGAPPQGQTHRSRGAPGTDQADG